MAGTVLLVESDPELAAELTGGLGTFGYEVSVATTSRQAQCCLQRAGRQPDLVLLDLTQSDSDGLIALCALRALGDLPIVALARTRRRGDAMLALRLGADDAVAHPCEARELDARFRAILRRVKRSVETEPSAPPPPTQVGALTLDHVAQRATLGDRPLMLEPGEFRLLAALANAGDQIISRKELAERLWGKADGQDGKVLDLHVTRLRKKLASARPGGPTIAPVRLQAFRLMAADYAPGRQLAS